MIIDPSPHLSQAGLDVDGIPWWLLPPPPFPSPPILTLILILADLVGRGVVRQRSSKYVCQIMIVGEVNNLLRFARHYSSVINQPFANVRGSVLYLAAQLSSTEATAVKLLLNPKVLFGMIGRVRVVFKEIHLHCRSKWLCICWFVLVY